MTTQLGLLRRALLGAVRRGLVIAVVTVLASVGLGIGLLMLALILGAL